MVPDETYDIKLQYPSDWFENYFSFVNNPSLARHLGEAFYQARFMYKLMSALKLPLQKNKGIVKFQIIQYASICEALIDTAITDYYKTEAENTFSVIELKPDASALAKDVSLKRGTENLVICKKKIRKGIIKRTRIDSKTEFASTKGIITDSQKDKLNKLYNLRNNVHILKAATTNYTPRLKDAKEAFLLMQDIVESVKSFYLSHPQVK